MIWALRMTLMRRRTRYDLQRLRWKPMYPDDQTIARSGTHRIEDVIVTS